MSHVRPPSEGASSTPAEDFLRTIVAPAQGQTVEIRAFEKPGGRILRRFFAATQEAADYALSLRDRADVYYGICPRDGEQGTAQAISRANCVWLDLDAGKGYDLQQRRDQVAKMETQPSVLVESGRGLHAYWLLDSPATTKDELARAQAIMRSMSQRFACDTTADLPRIFRVPGTFNHKVDPPAPVQVATAINERTSLARLELWVGAEWSGAESAERRMEIEDARPDFILHIERGIPAGGDGIFNGRNAAMFRWGCWMRDLGVPLQYAMFLAEAINQSHQPPLAQPELHRTIRSAYLYERNGASEITLGEASGPVPSASPEGEPGLLPETLQPPSTGRTNHGRLQPLRIKLLGDFGDSQPPDWLWAPYLPRGRFVMLDGEGGIGKGLFLAYIAAKFASSDPVLWLAAEDDPQDDIKQRITAAAEMLNVPVPHAEVAFLDEFVQFNGSAGEDEEFVRLEQQMKEGGYKILVLDPGRSFIRARKGARDFSHNNEADVRPTLERLTRLAKTTGATVLFVHHWNKSAGQSVRNRATGSGAYTQVPRHVLSMSFNADTGEGALGISKSNIAAAARPLSYTLAEVDGVPVFSPGALRPEPSMDSWERGKGSSAAIHLDAFEHALLWASPKLQPGHVFPNRSALAKQLGISENRAKEALAKLKREGYVSGGKGPTDPLRWTGKPTSSPQDD
ncbi:MAG TPA: AAA family ATPase [Actinomycetota bacterium]|nr:AAA family ATPase [Actinomycetota bacterium]